MLRSEILCQQDTTLHACSVEICRGDDADDASSPTFSHQATYYLVCGSYQLNEEERMRHGRLSLYHVEGNDKKGKLGLTPVQRVEMKGGVLDCKWQPKSSILACALSNGEISLCRLQPPDNGNDDGQHAMDDHQHHYQLSEPFIESEGGAFLSLALDWSQNGEQLISSQSDGSLRLWKYGPDDLTCTAQWQAHALYDSPIEVWTTTFADHQSSQLILSGGDDSAFKGWDMRCGTDRPIWSNTKTHEAGVTSMQACPDDDRVVATGSYDGRLRLWDMRQMKAPLLSTDYKTGGGIWRLKWHPSKRSYLALACMHAGAIVVEVEGLVKKPAEEVEVAIEGRMCRQEGDVGKGGIESRCRHELHESMAYGIDWYLPTKVAAEEKEGEGAFRPVLASCSFYDHALHLWRPSASIIP